MECSYCKSKMEIANVRVKRPVPQGAIDLDIHDTVVAWQCPKCHLTSQVGIEICQCGVAASFGSHVGLALRLITVRYNHFTTTYANAADEYGCTECVKCAACGDTLKTSKIVSHEQVGGTTLERNTDGDLTSVPYIYQELHFHADCYTLWQEVQQQHQAEKVRLEERSRRVKAGVCEVCGGEFGLLFARRSDLHPTMHDKCQFAEVKTRTDLFSGTRLDFAASPEAGIEDDIDEDNHDFCYHCGASLKQTTLVCPHCGKRL